MRRSRATGKVGRESARAERSSLYAPVHSTAHRARADDLPQLKPAFKDLGQLIVHVRPSVGPQAHSVGRTPRNANAHSWIPTHVFRGSVGRAGEGEGCEGSVGRLARWLRCKWTRTSSQSARRTSRCGRGYNRVPLARSTLSASQRRPTGRSASLTHVAFPPEPPWRKSLVRTNLHTHTRCSTAQPMPFRRLTDPHRAGAAQAHYRLVARVQSPTQPLTHPPTPLVPLCALASRPPTHSDTIAHDGSQLGLPAACRMQQLVPVAPLQLWRPAVVVCCALRRCIPVACCRHARGRRACSTTLLSTAVQMPTLRGVPHAPCPTFTRTPAVAPPHRPHPHASARGWTPCA